MAESIRGKPMKTKTFETEAGTPKVKKLVENDIYTGRTHAPGASRDADGLMSKKHAAYEKMIQQPQNRKGDNVEERGAWHSQSYQGCQVHRLRGRCRQITL